MKAQRRKTRVAAVRNEAVTREDVTDLIYSVQGAEGHPVGRRREEGRPLEGMGHGRVPRADDPHPEQAEKVGKIFGLPAEAVKLLQVVPYKGSLPTAVPTDPLIYRLYEIVNVYGTTIKELIHEEFGDGIMSAIDFKMDIVREPDPKGDRVLMTLNGKFLPYKTY
jgi:cyanate lyase